jgi:hypothetical protein
MMAEERIREWGGRNDDALPSTTTPTADDHNVDR